MQTELKRMLTGRTFLAAWAIACISLFLGQTYPDLKKVLDCGTFYPASGSFPKKQVCIVYPASGSYFNGRRGTDLPSSFSGTNAMHQKWHTDESFESTPENKRKRKSRKSQGTV